MLIHSNNSILHFKNIKIYNYYISSYIQFSKFFPFFYLETGFFKTVFSNYNCMQFLLFRFSWFYLISNLDRVFKNFSFYTFVYRFKWFRFVLFSGLGYKRRVSRPRRTMFVYIADRHWILYKFKQPTTILPFRKRDFVFFSPSKGWFSADYNFFSSLRTPYIYKMKGFLDYRVKRRFLFVRRIRLRGIKTKLSKKQQML